jgi:hypothetical protein
MWRVTDTEYVEVTCKHGGSPVKQMVFCDLGSWWHDSSSFELGDKGKVLVSCEAH